MSALDDVFGNLPEGLRPGADPSSLTVGTVTGVDVAAKQVQVLVGGSDPLWVPAAPDIYVNDAKVRLLRSPLDGGRIAYCLGALDSQPEFVTGLVTAVNSSAGTLTVSCLGASWEVPYVPGTYTAGVTSVHVWRSLKKFGTPSFVWGPVGNFGGSGGTAGSSGSSNAGKTVSRQKTITPTWSGSYRSGYGWDRWNTDRYGGRSTLWQGSAFGSGAMTGLAAYGNQIVNLGAASITSMVVTVTRADSSSTTGKTPTLQASSNGSQPGGAPSTAGATAAGGSITPGQTTKVTLPSSTYNSFRTGAYKGVATVGSDYGGFYGTARGDGFALTIQYTVVA